MCLQGLRPRLTILTMIPVPPGVPGDGEHRGQEGPGATWGATATGARRVSVGLDAALIGVTPMHGRGAGSRRASARFADWAWHPEGQGFKSPTLQPGTAHAAASPGPPLLFRIVSPCAGATWGAMASLYMEEYFSLCEGWKSSSGSSGARATSSEARASGLTITSRHRQPSSGSSGGPRGRGRGRGART